MADLRFTMGRDPQIRLKSPVSELKGEKGDSFVVKSLYPTLEALQTSHPVGKAGDVYAIGTEISSVFYIWDLEAEAWTGIGGIIGGQPYLIATDDENGNVTLAIGGV